MQQQPINPKTITNIGEKMESLISDIEAYIASKPESDTANKLKEHKANISSIYSSLTKTHYSVAFIGKIGVGKTSAICKLADLTYIDLDRKNGQEIVDVLKTGSGRTTVCEVRIKNAPKLSISIEPMIDTEIKKIVNDFADFIWSKSRNGIDDDEDGGNLLSEEMTRCVRNMLGLTLEKRKFENSKYKTYDKAVEFAAQCQTNDEVKDYMFQCLALEERSELEIWPNQNEMKDWKIWLRENFSHINDGKNKRIPIPRIITINGPFGLERNGISWTLIDTRGIDGNVNRKDLSDTLDADGTFAVITTSFNDAPDADCRALLEMSRNHGQKSKIERDGIVLALDKDESRKVSDISDEEDDKDERRSIGRSIREDQIATKLSTELKIQPTISFFDSRNDDKEIVWAAIEDRLAAYISDKEKEIEREIAASKELLAAEELRLNEYKLALHSVFASWREIADENSPAWDNFGLTLTSKLSTVHHRTLAASVSRTGEYDNFDFYEIAAQIARANAVAFCETTKTKLLNEIEELKTSYPEFSEQISSVISKINDELSRFSIDVAETTKLHWLRDVKPLMELWSNMELEWGRGPGYMGRVATHFRVWVGSDNAQHVHDKLLRSIASHWGRVLTSYA